MTFPTCLAPAWRSHSLPAPRSQFCRHRARRSSHRAPLPPLADQHAPAGVMFDHLQQQASSWSASATPIPSRRRHAERHEQGERSRDRRQWLPAEHLFHDGAGHAHEHVHARHHVCADQLADADGDADVDEPRHDHAAVARRHAKATTDGGRRHGMEMEHDDHGMHMGSHSHGTSGFGDTTLGPLVDLAEHRATTCIPA